MVKQKQSARPAKKPKSKVPAIPRTAAEFQEAADFEEETGGKWRAGDSAKSARAFVRALEIYDRGLAQFPSSFDLAYNKARLQLEVSQQPAIAAGIGLPLIQLLRLTLDSHRAALRLNATNPDVLFNTSQVLTSLAEHLLQNDQAQEGVPLLHEALELLSVCFSRQEMLIEQQQADAAAFEKENNMIEEGGVLLPTDNPTTVAPRIHNTDEASDESEAGDAATIEMPVTPSDVLDTIQASLSALTTLVPYVDAKALQTLGDMASTLTEEKVPTFLQQLEDADQVQARSSTNVDRGNFVAAFADAQYRYNLIDTATYLSRVDLAFSFAGEPQEVAALVAEAEARQEFALSVISASVLGDIPASSCWKQLSLAQTTLTKATQLKSSTEIYASRGDIELCRHRLVTLVASQLSEAVRNSAPTLLQNAQTFYRNAMKLVNSEDMHLKETIEKRFSLVTALRAMLYGVTTTETTIVQKAVNVDDLKEVVDAGLLDTGLAELLVANMNT